MSAIPRRITGKNWAKLPKQNKMINRNYTKVEKSQTRKLTKF